MKLIVVSSEAYVVPVLVSWEGGALGYKRCVPCHMMEGGWSGSSSSRGSERWQQVKEVASSRLVSRNSRSAVEGCLAHSCPARTHTWSAVCLLACPQDGEGDSSSRPVLTVTPPLGTYVGEDLMISRLTRPSLFFLTWKPYKQEKKKKIQDSHQCTCASPCVVTTVA